MELVHSMDTKAVPASSDKIKPSDLMGDCDFIGGAVEDEYDEYTNVGRFYRVLSIHEIDRYVDGASWFTLGTYLETIEEAIKARHREDVPEGMTCIERVTNFEIVTKTKTQYGHQQYDRERASGWIAHDRPFTESYDIEHLTAMSVEVGGPIIVSDDAFEELGCESGLNLYGFTCSFCRSGRWRVNYNPKAIKRRPYLKERKEAMKRLAGHWPDDLLHNLMDKIHPSHWPNSHPYSGVVSGPSLTESRGWGHQHNNSFDPSEIMQLRDLSLKLWPKNYWWRDFDTYSSYSRKYNFAGYVEEALEYVHGVEDWIKQDIAKQEEAARNHHQWQIEQEMEVIPLEEFVVSYTKAHGHGRREESGKFCRWLRAEAKAMKITMPSRPVLPLSPAAKERKKKRAAKSRAAARKKARKKKGAKKK